MIIEEVGSEEPCSPVVDSQGNLDTFSDRYGEALEAYDRALQPTLGEIAQRAIDRVSNSVGTAPYSADAELTVTVDTHVPTQPLFSLSELGGEVCVEEVDEQDSAMQSDFLQHHCSSKVIAALLSDRVTQLAKEGYDMSQVSVRKDDICDVFHVTI